jgi:hypothetical protein
VNLGLSISLSTSARLALFTAAVALLLEPGHLGSTDTERRLRVAHSHWTDAPPMADRDYPRFTIPGRDGRYYPPYGMGQGFVMLPADMAATLVTARLGYTGEREEIARFGLVALLTFPPLAVALIVTAFRLLGDLGFGERESLAGALALLLATSCLHYVQIHQENSLMLLCTLLGLRGVLRWRAVGGVAPLAWGVSALGFNLLVRPTTVFDLAAVGAFGAALMLIDRTPGRIVRALWVAVPVAGAWLALERGLHWWRFGDVTSNFIQLQSAFVKAHWHELSGPEWARFDRDAWPFSLPFAEGVRIALASPEKSVFAFDPLLILAAGLWVAGWRRIPAPVQALMGAMTLLLGGLVVFYARWDYPGGDSSWGNRFTATPVQLLAMLAVPLALSWRAEGPAKAPVDKPSVAPNPVRLRAMNLALWAILATSAAVQLASAPLSYNLEYQQRRAEPGRPVCVVALRFENLARWAVGRPVEFGDRESVVRWVEPNLLAFKLHRLAPGPLAAAGPFLWLLAWLPTVALARSLLARLRG